MPVSQIKALFEQIAEKFGNNPNIQVISGNIEEVIGQLREEAAEVAAAVKEAARKGASTGSNAIQELIEELNAQFAGEEVEVTHRPLSDAEMEAELLALLNGNGNFFEEDDRELQDLSHGELLELVVVQDETLELATLTIDALREQAAIAEAQIAAQEELIALQSKLLEDANGQLTAMHEGVDQLNGLLEKVKSANHKLDTHTRTISLADLLNGLTKG